MVNLYTDTFPCCRFEDYVGQLEAATAVAGLSAEKERAPAVKDRKELAAIQEVQLLPCFVYRHHAKKSVKLWRVDVEMSDCHWHFWLFCQKLSNSIE